MWIFWIKISAEAMSLILWTFTLPSVETEIHEVLSSGWAPFSQDIGKAPIFWIQSIHALLWIEMAAPPIPPSPTCTLVTLVGLIHPSRGMLLKSSGMWTLPLLYTIGIWRQYLPPKSHRNISYGDAPLGKVEYSLHCCHHNPPWHGY